MPRYADSWTKGAFFCYLRGCNCANCPVNLLVERLESLHRCSYKTAVLNLFLKGVAPPKMRNEIEREVIDDI